MNVTKVLTMTAAVASVVGAIGFSYAQNINYKTPSNTTQTQSDAALPCQPGPFNPHLPNDPRTGNSGTAGTSGDCATVTPARVQVRTETVASQPAPFNPPVETVQAPVSSVASTTDTSSAFRTASNDNIAMAGELEPRADRN